MTELLQKLTASLSALVITLSSVISPAPIRPAPADVPALTLGAIQASVVAHEGDALIEIVDTRASSTPDGKPVFQDGKPLIQQTIRMTNNWRNYKTPEGTWAKIDTTLRQTAEGFVMDKAPFEFTAPLRSTGTAIFLNNNRWDQKNKENIDALPLSLLMTAEGVLDVPGRIEHGKIRGTDADYVIYQGAYADGSDLIYYISFGGGPQLEKLVRLNASISQDRVYNFVYEYSRNVEFERDVNGKKTKWQKSGVLSSRKEVVIKPIGIDPRHGIGLKDFKIWDSNNNPRAGIKSASVQVDIQPLTGNRYRMSKIVPASFFTADVVYPVFTDITNLYFPEDADHGTLVDGLVDDNSSITWATVRDKVTAQSVNDTGIDNIVAAIVYCDVGSYQIVRYFHLTATGDGVGINDTIDDARYSFYENGVVGDDINDGNDFVGIILTNPASETALAIEDFDSITDNAGTNPHTAAVEFRTGSDFPTSSTASSYDLTNITNAARFELVLNATGTAAIGKGVGARTKMGAAIGFDIINKPHAATPCAAAKQNYIRIDQGEGTNPPFLELTISSSSPVAAGGVRKIFRRRSI